jgi:hypothetical protein
MMKEARDVLGLSVVYVARCLHRHSLVMTLASGRLYMHFWILIMMYPSVDDFFELAPVHYATGNGADPGMCIYFLKWAMGC